MLRLLLVRHGESPKKHGQTDFDRELNSIGEAEGIEANNYLKNNNLIPQLVISSNAPRAIKTANIVFKNNIIEINSELYNADITKLTDTILGFNDSIKSIAIVGHNPSITAVISSLQLENLDKYIIDALNYQSTTKIVVVDIKCDTWHEALKASCTIKDVFKPR